MPTRRRKHALRRRCGRVVGSARSVSDRLERCRRIWRVNAVLLGCGLLGLWLADRLAASAPDPFVLRVKVLVAAIVGSSMLAIGLALLLIVTRAQSHAHHVFCSGHALASALFSVAFGAVLAVAVVRRDLFQHLLSTGHIGGPTIVDVGVVFALAACMIASIAAAFGALDAYRDERTWGASLDIGHRGATRPRR